MKLAVIKAGGKQYLVTENDEIFVDLIEAKPNDEITLETLMTSDKDLELGTPLLKNGVKALVLEHLQGDKLRVSKFKSKVRYRKTRGFRAQLTKLKILAI